MGVEILEYKDNIELVVDITAPSIKEFDKEQLYNLFYMQSMNYYERRVEKHHNISSEERDWVRMELLMG